MSTVTQGDFLNACDKLLAAATGNPKAEAEGLRKELEQAASGVREAQARRNQHKFLAQQASRDLDDNLDSAREIYSRMRRLLQALFGIDSEELVAYGILPYRGQQVSLEQKLERLVDRKKEKPSGPGVAPARTADSQTESTS